MQPGVGGVLAGHQPRVLPPSRRTAATASCAPCSVGSAAIAWRGSAPGTGPRRRRPGPAATYGSSRWSSGGPSRSLTASTSTATPGLGGQRPQRRGEAGPGVDQRHVEVEADDERGGGSHRATLRGRRNDRTVEFLRRPCEMVGPSVAPRPASREVNRGRPVQPAHSRGPRARACARGPHRHGRARRLPAAPGGAPGAGGGRPDPATGEGLYVVTLAGQPSAAHRGTRPDAGERFDRTRPAARGTGRGCSTRQRAVLADVGDPDVLYRYTTALNGFAAAPRRTAGQAAAGAATTSLLVERSVGDPRRPPGHPGLPRSRPPRRTLAAGRRPREGRTRHRRRRRRHRDLAGQPQLRRAAAAGPRHRPRPARLPRRLRPRR